MYEISLLRTEYEKTKESHFKPFPQDFYAIPLNHRRELFDATKKLSKLCTGLSKPRGFLKVWTLAQEELQLLKKCLQQSHPIHPPPLTLLIYLSYQFLPQLLLPRSSVIPEDLPGCPRDNKNDILLCITCFFGSQRFKSQKAKLVTCHIPSITPDFQAPAYLSVTMSSTPHDCHPFDTYNWPPYPS